MPFDVESALSRQAEPPYDRFMRCLSLPLWGLLSLILAMGCGDGMQPAASTAPVSTAQSSGSETQAEITELPPPSQRGAVEAAIPLLQREETAAQGVENIQRAYEAALASVGGRADHARVREILDLAVDRLTQAYMDFPQENASQFPLIRLLASMHDDRAMPAFLRALHWHDDLTERHAIAVAVAFRHMDISSQYHARIIDALSDSLARVQNDSEEDFAMRDSFIRALGHLEDQRATPALIRVATRLSNDQHFRFNRLAMEELGRLHDASSVQPVIEGLFLYPEDAPHSRMNDVARAVLVAIGEPAVQELISMLEHRNRSVSQLVHRYMTALRRSEDVSPEERELDRHTIVVSEVADALGHLGYAQALPALIQQLTPLNRLPESRGGDALARRSGGRLLVRRALHAMLGMLMLNLPSEQDHTRRHDAIVQAYSRLPHAQRTQVLEAMRSTFTGEYQAFLVTQIAPTPEALANVHQDVLLTYATLANRTDAEALNGAVASSGQALDPAVTTMLNAAMACDVEIPCWIERLHDAQGPELDKTIHMLGRYGVDNASAVSALSAHLDTQQSPDTLVEILYALAHTVTDRTEPVARAAVDRLRHRVEGTETWTSVEPTLLFVQARLHGYAFTTHH